jgi:hypothetical protein
MKFLSDNGWQLANEKNEDDEYYSFSKDGCFDVDINDTEIVIVADVGDIQHLPVNKYALIGYLFDKRQIHCGYKS